MEYIQLAAGLALLFVGAELLVSGSVKFARGIGFPPVLIGLTLVAFGTSIPELATSIDAALADSPGIAIGNVVGSNITNILLIIGLVALVSPIACAVETVRRDGSVMVVTALMCQMALLYGQLTLWIGLLFVAGLVAYILGAVRYTQAEPETGTLPAGGATRHAMPLLIALIGLMLVLVGASWLVDGSILIAHKLGVNESVIGLSIVAAGTSMPELVTSLVAAIRRQPDIAIGNIIGSNIFNVLGILGVTAIMEPIWVPEQIRNFDGYLMCAVTLAFIAASITGRRISRGEGAVFVALYVAYMGLLATHVEGL